MFGRDRSDRGGAGNGTGGHGAAVARHDVLAALARIQDPDLRRDIVSLWFVRHLAIAGGRVAFTIELPTPACPVKGQLERRAQEAVGALPGVARVE
jgi:ATP-binding protein involved in chromosome partitioning